MSRSQVVLLFPGQGAQYVGMGRDLAKKYAVVQKTFAAADEVLDFSISELCFNGPEDQLTLTENTQPAVLTMSLACWAVMEEAGVEPTAAAGLSLGEYAALVAARSLDFRTAVKLVHERGRLMEQAVPAGEGGMAALLGLAREEVDEICRRARGSRVVEPANYNCPGQVVISGHKQAVAAAGKMAIAAGGKYIPLKVSGPFHSSLLQPAGEKLAVTLAHVDVKVPVLPVVSNVTGDYVTTGEEVKDLLVRQVSSPVLWEDSMRRLSAAGYNIFIELGPGKALYSFLRRINCKASCFNVQDVSSLKKTLAELKGVG